MRASMRSMSLNGTGTVRSASSLRDAGAVRDRPVVVAVAHVGELRPDHHHHAVVVTVVRAGDLHDRVAPGVRAGDADRVHRRLGAGVGEAPLRQPEPARELLADLDRLLGRHGEVRPEAHPLLDRARDRRVRVALHHRAEAVVEVAAPRAVDVPHVLRLAAREVDRPRLHQLVRRGDATRQHRACALEGRPRRPGRLLEALLLLRGQLADPPPVDVDRLTLSHRLTPLSVAL